MKMLLISLILAAFGCAADDMTTGDEVEELAGKADRAAPLPIGTFHADPVQLGAIRELTLSADHRFARWIQVIDCIPLKGCGPETGGFQYTRNLKTGARYLRFLDADGDLIDRYQYTFDGAALVLRRDDATAWTSLTAP